jgi:hypothetical protein
VPVKISELRELLSEFSLYTPMRLGLEAFIESRMSCLEGVNLLIHMEVIQEADSLVTIIEPRV